MSTISQAELYALFTEGQDQPHTRNLLDDALAQLGWTNRATYSPEEVLAIEKAMLEIMRGGLSGMDDPFAQKMAAVMGAAQRLLKDDRLK